MGHKGDFTRRHTQFPLFLTFALLLSLCILLIAGCKEDSAHPSHIQTRDTPSLVFTDHLDRVVSLAANPKRVVALSASFAETWLLAGGTLIGTTSDAHTRDEYTLAEDVAIIGTIKDPSSEAILSLEPDFVLLSTDIPSHLGLSALLSLCEIPHAYFHVEDMDDYLFMLDICTTLTGQKVLYTTHGLDVQQTIHALLASEGKVEKAQTYLLLRSYATQVKAKGKDSMVTKMLGDFGLTNLTELYPSLLEELSMETIMQEDPPYIFVIPMGDEAAAKATMDHMLSVNEGFASLDAVRNGKYFMLPKNLFHYKPNNRWGDSYAYLATLLFR